jgi:hypothetical protein
MGWPAGRPRPKKVGTQNSQPAVEQNTGSGAAPLDPDSSQASESEATFPASAGTTPPDWRKGALLNVRNRGDAYVITLYPEEFSDERPERALRFTNPAECQDFVSKWYAAEHHDPRAR